MFTIEAPTLWSMPSVGDRPRPGLSTKPGPLVALSPNLCGLMPVFLGESIDLLQEAGADGLQAFGGRHLVGSAEAHVRAPAEPARARRVAGHGATEGAGRDMLANDVRLGAVNLGAVDQRLMVARNDAVDVECRAHGENI